MILVVDSGSTKADWIAGNKSEISGEFQTKGFNPFFHNRDFIFDEIKSNKGLFELRDRISQLFFFGAGCSSPARNEIIREALASVFTHAFVVVDHDMLGCAIAISGGKPGIACILGTGSNISFFDGKNISPVRHGLGYVLGDEGSGSYFGKKLLAYYIYRIMPSELENAFRLKYKLEKEEIISKVYQEPNANVFLASFATFLSDHNSHPYIQALVRSGIHEFFVTNVLSYPECKSTPVHFVGSIAHYFRNIIEDVALQFGIEVGTVARKPVNALADYFLSGGKMP